VAIRAQDSKFQQLCLTRLISVSDLSIVVISPRRRNSKIGSYQLSAMTTDHDSDTPDDGLRDDENEFLGIFGIDRRRVAVFLNR